MKTHLLLLLTTLLGVTVLTFFQLFAKPDFTPVSIKDLVEGEVKITTLLKNLPKKQLDFNFTQPKHPEDFTLTCNDFCVFSYTEPSTEEAQTMTAYTNIDTENKVTEIGEWFVDKERRLVGYENLTSLSTDIKNNFLVFRFGNDPSTGLLQVIKLDLPSQSLVFAGYDYELGYMLFTSKDKNNGEEKKYAYSTEKPSLVLVE